MIEVWVLVQLVTTGEYDYRHTDVIVHGTDDRLQDAHAEITRQIMSVTSETEHTALISVQAGSYALHKVTHHPQG